MSDEQSFNAIECGHCGASSRMRLLNRAYDLEEVESNGGPPAEAGMLYQVLICPKCRNVNLIGGSWHEYMEYSEWQISIQLPDPALRNARKIQEQRDADLKFMKLAIKVAEQSKSERGKISPYVGAVVAHNITELGSGYRGQYKRGEHAEYTLLERVCKSNSLQGATVYTTLEPCTTRKHPKRPCAKHLIARKVSRVVIGMLDPDKRILGRGVLLLRKHNIAVELFPTKLMSKLEELNRNFIREKETPKRVRKESKAAAQKARKLVIPK